MGFSRVNLKPEKTRHVSMVLDGRSFAFYDVAHKSWKAEPGDFSVLLGSASDDIRLTGTFTFAP